MSTISIAHAGRTVARAGRTRFWFGPSVEELPDGHPRKRWIAFMALYARAVLVGDLAGPYTDDDAERFARACLIPLELVERPRLDVLRAAAVLEVPDDLLRDLHDQHRQDDP